MAGRVGSALQSGPAVACMKILLTIFNFIFWVSGVAVLGLGIWMKFELFLYMELTNVYYDFAPYVLIGVGSAIVVIGSFGCLCTFKGHSSLLYVFSVFLILVFVVELATAVSVFIFREKVEDGFSNGFSEAMMTYGVDEDKRRAVDGIQAGLMCCGKESYDDWYKMNWTGQTPVDRVPSSCCRVKNCDGTGYQNIYTEGCFNILSSFIQTNFTMIGGVAIGFAFLQLFGAFLSCCLARNINKSKYEQMA